MLYGRVSPDGAPSRKEERDAYHSLDRRGVAPVGVGRWLRAERGKPDPSAAGSGTAGGAVQSVQRPARNERSLATKSSRIESVEARTPDESPVSSSRLGAKGVVS